MSVLTAEQIAKFTEHLQGKVIEVAYRNLLDTIAELQKRLDAKDAEIAAALEKAAQVAKSRCGMGGRCDHDHRDPEKCGMCDLADAIRSLITATQREALDLELVRTRIEEAKRNQWHDFPEHCPCPQCRRFIELKRQEQEILKRSEGK